MKKDIEQLTISLRDAQARYGLSRTSLTKIGKENNAIAKVGNKYLLFVDQMDINTIQSVDNNAPALSQDEIHQIAVQAAETDVSKLLRDLPD